jgi:nitrogen fixation protein FixH
MPQRPNTYQVSVKLPDGTPVTEATVTAVFSMPPMPAMNMPAMRSDAAFTHVGNGTYRGTGQLSMSGTWNVEVSVARGTEPPDSARFSIVAE